VEELVEARPARERDGRQVNILAGAHLSPADAEALADMARGFGLEPIVLPDLSGSLDGHVPEEFLPHTLGGTPLAAIRLMGRSAFTIAVGEHMGRPARALAARTGVPCEVLDRATGLAAVDRLVALLSDISGKTAPARLRRERARLEDAMLDAHFFTGGRRIAIGADPDLLFALASTLAEMGCEIGAAVATTAAPILSAIPAREVVVGDLGDLEARAEGCDLLITTSHGRAIADRLGIPLLRAGIPVFDRLGGPQQASIGYAGTARLIFEAANLLHAEAPCTAH
ncbi:MAG TPA: nitrogenase iron-molybdenum cofactor biosynthesis protein NifN, partial [Anaeromyxobacteraceae bacterium]|nr:nitrogenase iron-molybdenum cofactor biosynthesis protein NifN [Anaeromyxobacteraceae bacterium]